MKVDNIEKCEEALKKLNIKEFEVMPSGNVRIFDNVKINTILSAFSKENVEILSINSNEDSVEDYYLNLIKNKEER